MSNSTDSEKSVLTVFLLGLQRSVGGRVPALDIGVGRGRLLRLGRVRRGRRGIGEALPRAGVDGLVSQLFFSNTYFYDFIEKVRAKNINVPVEAGIMPVINCKQIERMVSLCNVKLPKKFTDVMSRFSDNKEAMLEIGIAYAVDQIIDLIANGVDGIHLYTMNNPNVANRIYEAIKHVIGRV